MEENNTTNQSNIKPTVAKIKKGTTEVKEKNDVSLTENTPSAEENLFASVYLSQKNNVVASEATEEPVVPVVSDESKSNDVPDKKKNNDNAFKIATIVLIVLTVLIFIASCAFLIYGLFKDEPTENNNTVILDSISAEISSPFNIEHVYSDSYPEGIQEKFKQLYDQNAQIAGWVTIPGTSIDMPVYKASNNSYYLKTDNYHVYNRYGVAFLDMYSNIKNLSKNTVIYAHNFDNGLIFDELHNYASPEFFIENPIIEYNSIYGNYKWKIIAAFYTNGNTSGDNGYLFYYIATEMGENSFMDFYNELQQRSLIHTGVDVQPSDKILTLSTCTYFFDRNGATQNARFAVVARLIRDGESEEIDASLVKKNDYVRYPQLYYDVFGGKNPYVNASKWKPENR